jgi:L-ascorbate metabolism protein UlaG (beta-lactamase superfamily)
MTENLTSPKIPFLKILRWQIGRWLSPKKQPAQTMPIVTHTQLPAGEYALWVGHATLWLRLGETTVAIDPVFGDIPMHHRMTPLPLPKEQLKADVVLITHAHYDHYDKATIQYMLAQNPDLIIVAPAGFWRYMKRLVDREQCFEMEWWESLMVGGLFITLVPARHWSKRTPFDTNKALWGGYVIQNEEHTLYHSGDSAMGDHFKTIGDRFEIDEAFLPIGAYKPEWIMSHNHINPPQALMAAHDLGAQTLIPIHYGTLDLSDEPLNEPLEWFKECAAQDTSYLTTQILNIGEVYRLSTISTDKST